MAKLFNQSIFLLVAVGLLALVEAASNDHHLQDHDRPVRHTHREHDHHEHDEDDHDHVSTETEITVPGDGSDALAALGAGGAGGAGGGSGKLVVNMKQRKPVVPNGACQCADAQVKDFMSKFMLLFQAYGSKELAPELQRVAAKMIDFILGYLAKEKPGEMQKIHSFLQGSVHATGKAVAKHSNISKRQAVDDFS